MGITSVSEKAIGWSSYIWTYGNFSPLKKNGPSDRDMLDPEERSALPKGQPIHPNPFRGHVHRERHIASSHSRLE